MQQPPGLHCALFRPGQLTTPYSCPVPEPPAARRLRARGTQSLQIPTTPSRGPCGYKGPAATAVRVVDMERYPTAGKLGSEQAWKQGL